ncbi:MAG TPA: helix-turn-helix transcriptional regulator [Planktothrix sp.]|jgi:DNA-binding XRE family transcriptional regulator
MITNRQKYAQYRMKLAKIRRAKQRTAMLLREMRLPGDRLLAAMDTEMEMITNDLATFEDVYIDPEIVDKLSSYPKMILTMRLSLGWSQEELARRAGFTRRQIGRLEQDGYDSARIKDALSIASTLHRALFNSKSKSPG